MPLRNSVAILIIDDTKAAVGFAARLFAVLVKVLTEATA